MENMIDGAIENAAVENVAVENVAADAAKAGVDFKKVGILVLAGVGAAVIVFKVAKLVKSKLDTKTPAVVIPAVVIPEATTPEATTPGEVEKKENK